MGSLLPLSLIGVIATFLLGVLVQSPISGEVPQTTQVSSSGDTVQQAADRFSLVYTGVIDDLLSFQKDPNYQRAEASRQKMNGYAGSLLPQFQAFTDEMRSQLDQLTAEYNTPTTTDTTTP